jgi:hypothetical protein
LPNKPWHADGADRARHRRAEWIGPLGNVGRTSASGNPRGGVGADEHVLHPAKVDDEAIA